MCVWRAGGPRLRQAFLWLLPASAAGLVLLPHFFPSPTTVHLQLHSTAVGDNPLMRTHPNGSRSPVPMLTFVPGIGRLGNRLFQYASTFGIARQTGRVHVVSQDDHLLDMFSGITATVLADKVKAKVVWEEQSMVYSAGLQEARREEPVLAVCCYLQSWRYFRRHEHALRKQFTVAPRLRTAAAAVLAEVRQDYVRRLGVGGETLLADNVTVVGVHVRRQDVSREAQRRRGYVTAPPGYVRRAISHYASRLPHVVFVMCSDDPAWCRQVYGDEVRRGRLVVQEGGSPAQDLALLAACQHTVMTVGTYGWWAGWLAGGNVTYYSGWPAPGSDIATHHRQQDFFPPHWTPLE